MTFLAADFTDTVEVSWAPAHQDIERVGEAANEDLNNPDPRSGGYQYANRLFPPSPLPPISLSTFDDLPQRGYSAVTQARTGHCFSGGYYHRDVPSESRPANADIICKPNPC
ncbi:hypothetical protein FS837_008728 [Tulasnella sp. UAMH 9824]|nr:hypothetical protein FS837_008728 [Tulasnella sp. UAMH 9824]